MLKQVVKPVIHIAVWSFVFVFPYFFMDFEKPHPPIFQNWLEMLFTVIFFYINYFYLINRYLFKQKYSKYALINLVIICLFMLVIIEFGSFSHIMKPKSNFRELPPPESIEYLSNRVPLDIIVSRTIFPLLMALGFAIAIKSTLKSKNEETRRKKIENEHLKSEIVYLKYQIQPHFFFNTMNNIYSLIDTQPENAKGVLHRLSKLMRYILYQADNRSVSISEEIDFIENYIELMKIRMANNVSVTFDKPPIIPDFRIVPLLYISLVENSFKHGIDAVKPSFLHIRFSLIDNNLIFISKNTYFPKDYLDKSGSGIGIENLIKRLDILYPEKNYTFDQKLIEDNYITKLIIPLKNE